MRHMTTQAAALAALALLASGCSTQTPTAVTASSGSATPSSDSAAASSEPSTEADAYRVVGRSIVLDGPGRWAMPIQGQVSAPLAVFDVPSGYQTRETTMWTHDEIDLDEFPGQVFYRGTVSVTGDPCDPDVPSLPGNSVQRLAAAFEAQQSTSTTRPVPVELGGYSGLYLELTSPLGEDFAACQVGVEPIVFETGSGEGNGGRWWWCPWTDRFWILDVEGTVVVVAAGTPAGAGAESVARVTDVAESVTFLVDEPWTTYSG